MFFGIYEFELQNMELWTNITILFRKTIRNLVPRSVLQEELIFTGAIHVCYICDQKQSLILLVVFVFNTANTFVERNWINVDAN